MPEHYVIQCHHYMAVTGASAWYLAVLILGKEFKYVRIAGYCTTEKRGSSY